MIFLSRDVASENTVVSKTPELRFIKSIGIQFYYVSIWIHNIELRPTSYALRIFFHFLELILRLWMEAFGAQEVPCLPVTVDPDRKMKVAGIDRFFLTEGRLVMYDQMKLAIPYLIPNALKIER